MKRKLLVFVSLFTLLVNLSFLNPKQRSFEKAIFQMESKTLANQQLQISKGNIYYSSNGDMLSHTLYPKEVYVLNNSKGSVEIYDPIQNTVIQMNNFNYSTENSQFYYFLQNKRSDMGLRSMGFELRDTEVSKDDKVITLWYAPPTMRKILKKIKLVHKEGKPVYMGYYDKENREVKKVYYYKYQEQNRVVFPSTITQFDYLPNGDSIITRTIYSDMKVNTAANSELFDFKIPEDSKVIKKKNQ